MKRFTTAAVVFGVSILGVWAIFQLNTEARPQPKSDNVTVKVQPALNEAVIPVTSSGDRKIAPVFDASGAVVSDPSGALLGAGNSGPPAVPVTVAEPKIAPVFDSSGAAVSDPSGTILNASPRDVKIAPVFDANGAVVSNPSGTILNSSNP